MYYEIALTLLPGIGSVLARNLVSYCGSAEAVFAARRKRLLQVPGVGEAVLDAIRLETVAARAAKEVAYIQERGIHFLPFTHPDYPRRLLQCHDAPPVLYYTGNADLNAMRILGIVGTRNASAYGRQLCEELVEGLAGEDVLIVSGLAYGIDITAHRACLKYDMPTVGVMAHGLDRIYPYAHRETAKKMQERGGLLTECISETNPDRQNFPKRNRIVAGMIDGLIVVETGVNGGAVITALLADDYHRDVMAFPGNVHQTLSAGCNKLIKQNRATLVENAEDVKNVMGWHTSADKKPVQTTLFPDLEPEEKIVYDLLQGTPEIYIDELQSKVRYTPGTLAGILLSLEFKGVVCALPGHRYKLMHMH